MMSDRKLHTNEVRIVRFIKRQKIFYKSKVNYPVDKIPGVFLFLPVKGIDEVGTLHTMRFKIRLRKGVEDLKGSRGLI